MSANNRSQGLMTVVATADFSPLFPFFPCICAIPPLLWKTCFVSSHLGRTLQQRMLEEVLIGTKQKKAFFTVMTVGGYV